MPRVSIKFAQTHLSQLIKQAAEGDIVVVTNHGKAVAQIVPPDKPATRIKVPYGSMKHLKGLGARWDRFEDEELTALFHRTD